MARLPYSGTSLTKLLAQQNPRAAKGGARSKGQNATGPAIYAQLQEGIALQMKGSHGLAAQVYQSILDKHPNNPDALHLMATVAMAAGQIDAAIRLLQRAVAGKPGDPAIRCNLASMLLQKEQPSTAEFHLRKALKTHPDLPAANCLLADCKALAGDRQGAMQVYEDVLARLPDEPQALIGYAELCVNQGNLPKAESLYRKALSVGAAPPLAVAGLVTCIRPAKGSPEADEVFRNLRQPGLRPIEYMLLSYAAGQIADATGDPDEAFEYYLKAKTFSATTFDMTAERRSFQRIKEILSRKFFEERAKYGSSSTRPVFIVGMPRSGTTLTEQIISRHPHAAAAGELPDITQIAGSLGFAWDDTKEFSKRITRLKQPEADALAKRYLAVLDRTSATAAKVTDKMPHNFMQLGIIALLFPKAKIVHCRRDPLDNCVSCFTTQLKDQLHGYTLDLGSLGEYYREYVSLMTHWREVLPASIYDLDYEKLIESPEQETRKLIDFVGLPWDPACLTPHESDRAVRTQSRMQVRQPIYRSSMGRWRRYEKHLGPLKAALGDLAIGAKDPALLT